MTEELIEPVPEPVPNGDLYLKFADEAEATAALTDYTGSIDIIGVIFKPSDEVGTDADGNEVPVMTAIPGWHVNTRGPMPAELLPFSVLPAQPVRIWA